MTRGRKFKDGDTVRSGPPRTLAPYEDRTVPAMSFSRNNRPKLAFFAEDGFRAGERGQRRLDPFPLCSTNRIIAAAVNFAMMPSAQRDRGLIADPKP